MKDKTKSIEELQTENNALNEQLSKLQEQLDKGSETLRQDSEMKSLQDENAKLKELIEKQNQDLANATKFAQQVLLQYGNVGKDDNYFNKDKQELTLEEQAVNTANAHLEEYLKQFEEQGD